MSLLKVDEKMNVEMVVGFFLQLPDLLQQNERNSLKAKERKREGERE